MSEAPMHEQARCLSEVVRVKKEKAALGEACPAGGSPSSSSSSVRAEWESECESSTRAVSPDGGVQVIEASPRGTGVSDEVPDSGGAADGEAVLVAVRWFGIPYVQNLTELSRSAPGR